MPVISCKHVIEISAAGVTMTPVNEDFWILLASCDASEVVSLASYQKFSKSTKKYFLFNCWSI